MAQRLLLVGDFAATSGFATVNEALAVRWKAAGWDIAVLAINYLGEPHPLQAHYRLYPAYMGGDMYGMKRIKGVVAREHPDIIVAVNDPQIVTQYLAQLDPDDQARLVGYIPVDGVALMPEYVEPLNASGAIVPYTQFGAAQLQLAGLLEVAAPLPHAIDPAVFYPVDRAEARAHIHAADDECIVLMADRNTHRKALDLGIQAFARFAEGKPDSVKLYYHGAVQDEGPRLDHVAATFGIRTRFKFNKELRPGRGLPASELRYLYSAADVYLSSTTGEGWGFGAHEALACGCPCVLPDFAAYSEWVSGGALLVPCDLYRARHYNSALGMQPSVSGLAEALERIYIDTDLRTALAEATVPAARQFSWDASAAQFLAVFDRVLSEAGVPA